MSIQSGVGYALEYGVSGQNQSPTMQELMADALRYAVYADLSARERFKNGKIRVCATNSQQLWNKTVHGTSRIALKFQEQMVRAQPAKNASRASGKQLP